MKKFIIFRLRALFITATFLMVYLFAFGQSPGLIVEKGTGVNLPNGGTAIFGDATQSHIAIDENDIQAKSSSSDYSYLFINYYGGDISLAGDMFYLNRSTNGIGLGTEFPDGPLDIDFDTLGSLNAGTPGGSGPGWLYFAPNGNRWDTYASNNSYRINRNGTANYLSYSNDGRLGLNNLSPDKMIDVDAGIPATNEGLRVRYTGGFGAALLAVNASDGGWLVMNGASSFAPIWASSFNVPTSPIMQRNQTMIDPTNYVKYVAYYDRLETAEFSYSHERSRTSPHIGIVAQTAPAELLSNAPEDPNELDKSTLSINLADWTGLNTVVIKYLLQENKQIQAELTKMKEELASFRKQL